MRSRRGFTLAEILVAMVLLAFVSGAAVQYLRRQSMLVAKETTRMDAQQNAQFAASQIERELREAGAGVVDFQPMIVQADSQAITFNANIVSIDSGDVRAVYQMPDADPKAVRGMLRTDAMALPNSSPPKSYPDTNYMDSKNVTSGAETISYWLRPDSSSTFGKRYALFRRVNAQGPTLVARGIVRDARDTMPVFTYYVTDTLNRLVPIAKSRFPVYHGVIHGAASDTGKFALPDSIRAVRVHFLVAARDPRTGKDALRGIDVLVRLMNAGLLQRTSCGQPPLAPSGATATSSPPAAPVKTVTLAWTRSSDDGVGEKDIERYAIFRKLPADLTFGDPIASIPASLKATYGFTDAQGLEPGQTYVYGIAAQDCTPSISTMSFSSAVTINP